MELYTEQELIDQIKNVDAQIEATLLGQEISIDTGQGSQTVKRASLSSLRQYRQTLMARLDALKGSGGVQYVNANFC